MLKSIRVGPRLVLGFSSVLVILLVITGVSIFRISHLSGSMEGLVKQDFAEQNNAANLLFQVYANSLRLGTLVTSSDPAEAAALKSDIQEEQIKIDERFERLVEAAAKSKDATPVDEMISAAGKLFNATNQLYKVHADGNREADIAFFQKEMVPLRSVYLEKVKGAYDEQSRRIQKSEQEARAVSNKTRIQIVWMGIIAVVTGITAAALILRSLVPPIRKTMVVLGAVANGDLSQTLEIDTQDELGAMAASLNTAVTSMKKSIEEVQHLREREKLHAEELDLKIDHLLEVVDAAAHGDLTLRIELQGSDAIGKVGEATARLLENFRLGIMTFSRSAESLATTSEKLSSLGVQMNTHADETASQARLVSSSARDVSTYLQTVAASSEEMAASIREISVNASESATIASSAVRIGETTTVMMGRLGESSQEIGQVIKVITSIAQQTNLLALNATIEAARSGEAGKGFAVVANEVKELAKATADATQDISRKVAAIQEDTKGAIDAIGNMSGVIAKINEISSTIAAAVEEQTATTNEIGKNVTQAATGSEAIARNISCTADVAQSAQQGAFDNQRTAEQLSLMSSELKSLVNQFKV